MGFLFLKTKPKTELKSVIQQPTYRASIFINKKNVGPLTWLPGISTKLFQSLALHSAKLCKAMANFFAAFEKA